MKGYEEDLEQGNKYIKIMPLLLLLCSLLVYTEKLSNTSIPTIFVILSSIAIFILYTMYVGQYVYIPLFLLFGIILTSLPLFLNSLIYDVEIHRAIIRTLTIVICMIFIPYSITREYIFNVLSKISAISIAFGIPLVFIGQISILGAEFGWPRKVDFLIISTELYPLQSFYTNPNFFSILILSGLISTLYLVYINPNVSTLFLLVWNGMGLYLTQSRTAIVAGIISIILFMVFKFLGGFIFKALISILSIIMATGIFIIVYQPTPFDTMLTVNLTGRRDIWFASWVVFLDRPLIGYGPVGLTQIIEPVLGEPSPPHNSYLRMFLETGLIGGLAYLGIILIPLIRHLAIPYNITTVVSYLLAFSIAIAMIFENFVIGGVGSSSVIAGIAFGYLIKDISHNSHEGEKYEG